MNPFGFLIASHRRIFFFIFLLAIISALPSICWAQERAPERPLYFEGEMLKARDFEQEQQYRGETRQREGKSKMEFNTDRPGGDFRSFDLREPCPEICREACYQDNSCVAYTYVKPGVKGPRARCFLKSRAPRPVSNPCCVSGIKEKQMKGEPKSGATAQEKR